MNHEHYMHQCLRLAQKGRGLVGSNPLVGSVLVRNGEVIAEGVYMGKGTPHAERNLLESFEQEVLQGDVLYVNLEPCCHYGDTPPCSDILLERGVKNIAIGMRDPDSRVAGQGTQQLRDAGVHIIGPVLPELCTRLNKGFVSRRIHNRPYITLKRAQTTEGAIATPDGSKLCITSKEQNIWSHTHLRTTHDAILVGVQTVITDDPELTIRLNPHHSNTFQPTPIILDPHLRIPKTAKVLRKGTVVITASGKTDDLGEATLLHIPTRDSSFVLKEMWKQLPEISSVLVEGGQKTWDVFKDQQSIDEEVVLIG